MLNQSKILFLFIILLLVSACTAGKHQQANSNGIEMPASLSHAKASDIAMRKYETPEEKTRGFVTLHVVGRGLAPDSAISKGQALILGQNAARADGYVKLAEKIHGVYVDSYRRIGRGIVDIEIIHQETQALLKGAEVLEYRRGDEGIYEAYMRVRVVVGPGHALFPLST